MLGGPSGERHCRAIRTAGDCRTSNVAAPLPHPNYYCDNTHGPAGVKAESRELSVCRVVVFAFLTPALSHIHKFLEAWMQKGFLSLVLDLIKCVWGQSGIEKSFIKNLLCVDYRVSLGIEVHHLNVSLGHGISSLYLSFFPSFAFSFLRLIESMAVPLSNQRRGEVIERSVLGCRWSRGRLDKLPSA